MTTFTPFKGRTITLGQIVEVYRNLHNGRWSIRDARTKLVLAHADNVRLIGAEFIVNDAGRQRVIREKKKNVHAFIKGAYMGAPTKRRTVAQEVTYNPYKNGQFYLKDFDKSIYCSSRVHLTSEKKVFVI